MPDAFDLNCCILGDDDPHRVFPVRISTTESVHSLGKLIKDEKKPALDHVSADTLVLWKVSIPVDKSFKDSISKFEHVDEESLWPVERLSKVFVNAPEEGCLHIVIKVPPIVTHPSPYSERLLVLGCLVLGDDPSRIFSIKIAATETVSALRKAIKDEKKPALDHVPADTLVLWKVSIPVDKSFKANISKMDLIEEELLSSLDRLSKVFANEDWANPGHTG